MSDETAGLGSAVGDDNDEAAAVDKDDAAGDDRDEAAGEDCGEGADAAMVAAGEGIAGVAAGAVATAGGCAAEALSVRLADFLRCAGFDGESPAAACASAAARAASSEASVAAR